MHKGHRQDRVVDAADVSSQLEMSREDPLARFHALRQAYLDEELTDADRKILARLPLEGNCGEPQASVMSAVPQESDISTVASQDWGDWRFHLRNRIHLRRTRSKGTLDELIQWAPELGHTRSRLSRLIYDGVTDDAGVTWFYDFSLLPLNALLGVKVRRYFTPPADYFAPHETKQSDPYGLLWSRSRAEMAQGESVAVVAPGTRALLGSHKFTHTLLMNLDFYCPIGCSDCYKSRLGTREFPSTEESVRKQLYSHQQHGRAEPPSLSGVLEHARRVARWLKHEPRGQAVYDVILSGGEPLILHTDTIRQVLEELGSAPGLRVLRICTGCLFLGLPMRFDEELVEVLSEFQATSGVRVTIQAHLACHEQITPEAIVAVRRLRRAGISIYSQVPIKAGINFFPESLARSVDALKELGRHQLVAGVEPYMFIVDMHPSTNEFYVPLEPLLAVWGELVESHSSPGLERPRTLSILFHGGNVVLSGPLLLAMSKTVDRKRGVVTYRIPRIGIGSVGGEIAEHFDYEEPLSVYNEDQRSLERLRLQWSNACVAPPSQKHPLGNDR